MVVVKMKNTQWSSQQEAIFQYFARGKGNLIVRARAGTGKTTTILEACGHAGHEQKILLAAFNKRIQLELAGRISAPNVEAKTLHALGFAYIRRQWNNIKIDNDVETGRALAAIGRSAPDDMVRLVAKLAGLLKNVAPLTASIDAVIDLGEEYDLMPDEGWEEEGWTKLKVAAAAIEARDLAKERDSLGRISFDDMIFVPLACDFVRPWYSMVVVDEAQDMNYAQLLLAQRACKKGGRVVVVGDDRQAIYGFRGADVGGLDRLKTELKANELGLTVTYRCAKAVVGAVRHLVPDFESYEGNARGTVDHIAESELVAAAKPGDFVLSRANAPLMSLCLAFLKKGVRARIEGRDVAATLRAIVDGFKAKTVPAFLDRVEGWKAKQVARALKVRKESVRSKKVEMIEDQADMLSALAEGCVSVQEIYSRVNTLFDDSTDEFGGSNVKSFVVLSSVHRAKGLEADRVFVLRSTVDDSDAADDEEKNIFYVAATRARKRLTWVGEPRKRKEK